MSIGERMFATYADKYADWVARGKPPSPSTPTHWVWKKKSRSLLERMAEAQEGLCSLCGKPLTRSDMTIDHVLPRSLGGQNHMNRLLAHGTCNRRKGSNKPTGCELVMLEAVNARLSG